MRGSYRNGTAARQLVLHALLDQPPQVLRTVLNLYHDSPRLTPKELVALRNAPHEVHALIRAMCHPWTDLRELREDALDAMVVHLAGLKT